MKEKFQSVFAEEKILLCEALPFSLCRVIAKAKLDRFSFVPKTAIVFLIPYYTGITGERNLSRYAVARDYHLYVSQLKKRLLPKLEALAHGRQFAIFADNSPIDERHAAALAGLGVMGDNGLLLTEPYGPYVFIGEVLTDCLPDEVGTGDSYTVKTCRHCGACSAACPKKELCLSALTQKKGELSQSEQDEIVSLGSVWGCDICQEVCPYAQGVTQTPISFFHSALLPYLTLDVLDAMSEDDFKARAYSWRGRNTVRRNILLIKPKSE